MKNNLHISILLFVSIIMLLTACEKEVALNVEEKDQKLVILCNFSPGEPFNVELTKSTSLFKASSSSNLVNDAEITICSGSYCAPAFPVLTPSDANSKYQPSDDLIIPQTDTEYSINIQLDGYDMISAVSSIPEPAKISHASIGSVTKYQINEFDSIGYDVRLAFQFLDNQTEENYYQVNFYQVLVGNNPNVVADTITSIVANQGFSLVDESLTGNFNRIDGGILFNDLAFQNSLQELVFQPSFRFTENRHTPIKIIMELRTVSKEYYNYYNSVYRQTSQDNVPFSDPTIIHSNIDNGLGVFAGYSKDRFKTDIQL